MDFKSAIKQIEDIIKKSCLNLVKGQPFSKQLMAVSSRLEDQNLYIGIVGEFSSGKSTLINSLIEDDFFETNSLQGTTTVITKLYWGKRINMVFYYKDGKKLKYSKNKASILKMYLGEEYEKLSSWTKFTIFINDLFNGNGMDGYFMKVFNLVTTSNEISESLDNVSVFYPSDILKKGIVFVDTPGTDSLIPEHAVITKRAIKEVCDTSIIVIPSTTPLSESLANFIEYNIGEEIKKCVFFITKTELLRKNAERNMLLKGIGQRITNYLGIDSPDIYMVPSLLALEEMNVLEKSDVLRHLSPEDRISLFETFKANISSYLNKIEEGRDLYKETTITSYLSGLCISLLKEFEARTAKLEQELETLHNVQTVPLDDVLNECLEDQDSCPLCKSFEAKIQNYCTSQCKNVQDYVTKRIMDSQTKDEVQLVTQQPGNQDYCDEHAGYCFDCYMDALTSIHDFYEDAYNNFKETFKSKYNIDPIDFHYNSRLEDSWRVRPNVYISTNGITTSLLLRVFMNLQSVKNEMKRVVLPQIADTFSYYSNLYCERLNTYFLFLNKQKEKQRQKIIAKYDKIVKKRIKEEKKKEQLLMLKIREVGSCIKTISNIINVIRNT